MSTEISTSDTVASPSPIRNDAGKRIQPSQASGCIPPQPGALQQLESQGQDGNRSSNPTLKPNHNPITVNLVEVDEKINQTIQTHIKQSVIGLMELMRTFYDDLETNLEKRRKFSQYYWKHEK